jgi:predicted MFS family arabinose efflux permease
MGNGDVFVGVGGVILAIAIYLVTVSTDFLVPMVVMAGAVAFVPAPIFSFVSKTSEPENLGLDFGILSSASGVGMSFGPYAAGIVRDRTGSYETSFILLSIFALLVTATALILRLVTKRNYV